MIVCDCNYFFIVFWSIGNELVEVICKDNVGVECVILLCDFVYKLELICLIMLVLVLVY